MDEDFNPPMADAFFTSFIEISHVESTTPSDTLQLTPLAGTSCGIAREGETVSYYDTTHDEDRCPNLGKLPEEADLPWPGGTDSGGGHDGPDVDSGPPILDEQLPLP